MAALHARGRRGALSAYELDEPQRKRACQPLENLPKEAAAYLVDCAMELDSKQKISAASVFWAAKSKQSSVVPESHVGRGSGQPCPRCIAGESGHFSHILGF